MDDSTRKERRVGKTQLNPAFRIDAGINSRRYKNGDPIEVAMYVDANGRPARRILDQDTACGGSVTPFNILCNSNGACAVKTIIFDGDDTIVLFADGDKVVVHRHPDDPSDEISAVLWALGEKVFGTDLVRQIKRAIKYRSAQRSDLHDSKKRRTDGSEST